MKHQNHCLEKHEVDFLMLLRIDEKHKTCKRSIHRELIVQILKNKSQMVGRWCSRRRIFRIIPFWRIIKFNSYWKVWTTANCTMAGIPRVISFPWEADPTFLCLPLEGGNFYCSGRTHVGGGWLAHGSNPSSKMAFLSLEETDVSYQQGLNEHWATWWVIFWEAWLQWQIFLFKLLWEAWVGHTCLWLERWVSKAIWSQILDTCLYQLVPEPIFRPLSVWLLSHSSTETELRR